MFGQCQASIVLRERPEKILPFLEVPLKRRLGIVATLGILILLATYGLLIFLSRNSLIVDGKTYVRYSFRKDTVQNLLDSFNIEVGTIDIVKPDLTQKLRWGEQVKVIRVKETSEEAVEEIDFVLNWKRKTTRNLRPVEIQDGYRKRMIWTIWHVTHDGVEMKTKRRIKSIKKIPVKRLVFIDKNNFPDKVYDLSKAKKVTVIATAYWKGDPQVPGDTTYLGHKVQRGLVAVDPTVIPLGYRLYVPGYGYAYSSDTGSAIKGKRIDLFVESKKASREWEHRKVDVYILEKAEEW